MAEGVNHVTKGAIRHGSHLTFCLRNPQNLGICRTKILCEVHQTLFFPSEYKRKKAVWPRETRVRVSGMRTYLDFRLP